MNNGLTPAPPELLSQISALLNRLKAQDETISELTGLAQELCATVIALKAFSNSVALSHPQPERLLAAFQDHMDYAADALKPAHIEIYRNDMHQLQNAILLAVQNQAGKDIV